MTSSRLSPDQLRVFHPLSAIYPAIGPPSFPSRPGSFVQIDCRLEGSSTERRAQSVNTGRCTSRVTIDMLPDVVLLEIFESYIHAREYSDTLTAKVWHTLVHVCRNWRTVVLGSPRRLDLRLLCTDETPVKERLGIWPPLPIFIGQYIQPTRMDDIIAALEHNDRVCEITLLEVTNSQLEQVLAVTQQPFPALTKLGIWWGVTNDKIDETLQDDPPPVVPKLFLGGSAPRLQYVQLDRIPFPGLPKLLLSATGLISLHIWEIPHSGYISPEAMVLCLSTLTRLERLTIGFESPLSRPVRESRRPRPPTRSVLPALTLFSFKGASEYSEDLVARIDAPLLDTSRITFFHQLIFNTPQLTQFVARTPNFHPPVKARMVFYDSFVKITSSSPSSGKFKLKIKCRSADWQLSSLTEVCSSSLPEAFLSTVETLYVIGSNRCLQDDIDIDIEDSQWLEVLHPFTGVKDLYLSREFTSRIGPALQEFAGEMLPSLQNILLEGFDPSVSIQGGIGKFVAARASYAVVVSRWDRVRGEDGLEEDSEWEGDEEWEEDDEWEEDKEWDEDEECEDDD